MESRRKVSIKDVAREAGVSHATVSRALRGSPLISPPTTALVHQTAERMGYTVNAVARSLVTGRTYTIGVVVTSIADPFVGGVIAGVEDCTNQRGYSTILATCHADPEIEKRMVASLRERNVDGILVTSSRVGEEYSLMLAGMRVPIVLLNNQRPGDYDYSVTIDNTGSARRAVEHLLQLGHRRIAYIGHASGYASDRDRRQGYEVALREAGLKPNHAWTLLADSSPESGAQAAAKLHALGEGPTAIFCYNDLTALGVLAYAREQGLAVPGTWSVVGFDDLFLSQHLFPPLTTVRQPMFEMGRRAAELLLGLIAGEESQARVQMAGELIVRQSTGVIRA
ncbi:MAG: LacI family transcriptional regulator [Bryobacteraceae bacterium]|nr:LacI family transcriptional regulator [Bryobacteraceae bacterium]